MKVLNNKKSGIHLWSQATNKRLHLPPGLHEVADDAIAFFKKDLKKELLAGSVVLNPDEETAKVVVEPEVVPVVVAAIEEAKAEEPAAEVPAVEEACAEACVEACAEDEASSTDDESKPKRGRKKE